MCDNVTMECQSYEGYEADKSDRYRVDTLFQLTSIIPGVRRPNSAGKSRSGSSTLIPSEIATAVELRSS